MNYFTILSTFLQKNNENLIILTIIHTTAINHGNMRNEALVK